MSSLMKSNAATQENPIFDVPIPVPPSLALSSRLEELEPPEEAAEVAEVTEVAEVAEGVEGTFNLFKLNSF